MRKLTKKDLRLNYNTKDLGYDKTLNIEDTTQLIYGQERGIKAFEFGLGIEKKGYNIYFEGPTGVGKTMYVKRYLAKHAKEKEVPLDYCYVYNFQIPDEPIAISLEKGKGKVFKKDIAEYIDYVKKHMKEAFKKEELEKQRKLFKEELEKEKVKVIDELNKETRPHNFAIVQGAKGVFMLPFLNGKIMEKEEYEKIDKNIQKDLESKVPFIQEKIFEGLTKIRELELEQERKVNSWENQIAEGTINVATKVLEKKYTSNQKIIKYIFELKKDILKNLKFFLEYDEEKVQELIKRPDIVNPFNVFEKYKVNLFVDNSETVGAPVIMDVDYNFENIFGKVEYENSFGAFKTDYTKIKSGLLQKANGGYIVFQARELLQTPTAYEKLKKILKMELIGIESSPDNRIPMILQTLKPEPIPINVKVIIIGGSDIYSLLLSNDPDFKKLFKIKTEFDDYAEINAENVSKLTKFISSYIIQENLLEISESGIYEMIEYASHLAGEHDKLTTNFAELGRVLSEASMIAQTANKSIIDKEDIIESLSQRKERVKKYDKRILELILKDTILINTSGSKVGEINGLSVTQIGDAQFGKPVKITANTYLGNKSVVNIERDVDMSGPTHSKGIGIITGYLGEKYGQNMPLAFTASIAFEQLYGGIDGDSASSTEIYSILSSLSELPINQGIAVTGSVNQKGFIQPIGGVNQKITGFFEVCKHRGFIGKQGVIIPEQNVDNLYLSDEIIDAIEKGIFNIYAIKTIDEGIEVLTGVVAGKKQKDGTYPTQSVNYLVSKKLEKNIKILRDIK